VGKMKDLAIDLANEEKASRGKRARQRGNAFEREVARKLNGKRVGQYGGKTDVETPLFVIQTKVGLSYPERLDKWLRELSPKADQLAVLVVGDSPGPGTRRRALAIMDLDDFAEWFGKQGETNV